MAFREAREDGANLLLVIEQLCETAVFLQRVYEGAGKDRSVLSAPHVPDKVRECFHDFALTFRCNAIRVENNEISKTDRVN